MLPEVSVDDLRRIGIYLRKNVVYYGCELFLKDKDKGDQDHKYKYDLHDADRRNLSFSL